MTNYMFTKAQGISYLREAIAMMFYKVKFNKVYNKIMLEKTNWMLPVLMIAMYND